MSYKINDTVTLSTVFALPGGSLADPTTVQLVVEDPSGTKTTFTWAGGGVTRDGVGLFHKDLVTTMTGVYAYEWTGTGTAAGVEQGKLWVEDLLATPPDQRPCTVADVKTAMEVAQNQTKLDARIQAEISAVSGELMVVAGTRNSSQRAPV